MPIQRNYVIEKRGSQWCLLTKDRSKTLGCHDSKEEALAQERAVEASKHSEYARNAWVDGDNAKAEKELKFALDTLKVQSLIPVGELVKIFAGFSQGLCDKFGMGSPGGTTDCISSMEGKVDDPGAFCASLHQWCTGSWPAEKKMAQDEESSDGDESENSQDGAECELPDGSMGVMKGGKCVPEEESPEEDAGNDAEEQDEKQAALIGKWANHGGPGSGHWGHAGREGERGGSAPGDSSGTDMDKIVQGAKLKDHVRGLKKWVEDYKVARHAGNVKLAKKLRDDIDKQMRKVGLWHMRSEIYGPDPDNPKNRGAYSLADQASQGSVPDIHRIDGVEIFAVGTHNGDVYTANDLDEIVAAAKEQGFTPPLKAGHDETPGKPAIGWIENVRRTGDKLFGDITHIPKDVYDTIKRRGYDRVSAEVYWNLKSSVGKTFRRALKAVALLGADVPAVATLTPLHKLFSGAEGEVHIYDQPHGGIEMAASDKEQLSALQQQLADLQKKIAGEGSGDDDTKEATVKQLSQMAEKVKILEKRLRESEETEHKYLGTVDELNRAQTRIEALEKERREEKIKDLTSEVKIPAFRPYIQAMLDVAMREETKVVKFTQAGKQEPEERTMQSVVRGLIEELNSHSRALFKEHSQRGHKLEGGDDIDIQDRQQVADAVDSRTAKYMSEHQGVSYTDALSAVLNGDPELKRAYLS